MTHVREHFASSAVERVYLSEDGETTIHYKRDQIRGSRTQNLVSLQILPVRERSGYQKRYEHEYSSDVRASVDEQSGIRNLQEPKVRLGKHFHEFYESPVIIHAPKYDADLELVRKLVGEIEGELERRVKTTNASVSDDHIIVRGIGHVSNS